MIEHEWVKNWECLIKFQKIHEKSYALCKILKSFEYFKNSRNSI